MLTGSILGIIGNTPLLQLKGKRIFVKGEFLNPGGNITTVLPDRAERYFSTALL